MRYNLAANVYLDDNGKLHFPHEALGWLPNGQPVFFIVNEEEAELEEDLFYCHERNCPCRLEEMS